MMEMERLASLSIERAQGRGMFIHPEVALLTDLVGEEIQPTNLFLGIMMEMERLTSLSIERAQGRGMFIHPEVALLTDLAGEEIRQMYL